MKKGTKTQKSAETRQRILDNALSLFRQKGFDKTTMREIAQESGVALGSAYYYFKTKEKLVLDYYAITQAEAGEENQRVIASTRDFKKRFDALLTFKFVQMKDDRQFVSVLAKSGADPDNPVSPFSPQTREIRLKAIELINDIITDSNIKVAESLRDELPRVLWLYQMSLIFFWINDKSKNQKQTHHLKDLSVAMLIRLMQMSNLPLMRKLNHSMVELFKCADLCAD